MEEKAEYFPHPTVRRLEEFLDEKGISRAQFLTEHGVYSQKYNNWRKRGIPKSLIPDVSKWTGLNYDYILSGEEPKFNEDGRTLIASGAGALATARQKVSEPPPAGIEPAPVNDDGVNRQNRLQIRSVPVLSDKEILQGIRQEPENRQYIPAQQVSNEAFAFPVGSIPNPNDRYGIDADMYIVVDPEAEWENGKPLLLKDINNNLLIRRYEVVGSKRYLAPFNDKYDPMELDTSFTVIGKIVSRHAMY